MNNSEITNWKLVEVSKHIEIVDKTSQDYTKRILSKLKMPLTIDDSINRKNTYIDWKSTFNYFSFFFDNEGEEKINEEAIRSSELSQKDNIIITYGWNEPTIKISTQKFIDDWEDFIASTQWETIIFSEDFELIMEVSRDYFIHSNFKIR